MEDSDSTEEFLNKSGSFLCSFHVSLFYIEPLVCYIVNHSFYYSFLGFSRNNTFKGSCSPEILVFLIYKIQVRIGSGNTLRRRNQWQINASITLMMGFFIYKYYGDCLDQLRGVINLGIAQRIICMLQVRTTRLERARNRHPKKNEDCIWKVCVLSLIHI